MGRKCLVALLAGALLAGTGHAQAQEPQLRSGSVLAAAQRLRPGQFIWAPEIAPRGPVLLVVSLATQRAVIYRNGVPIGISTVSTGRPGHRTPTGIFTVLERDVTHYSSLYDAAPMPYMQRLTWGGVALHGGQLPGYPASHGCIRLPQDFARLLYGVTRLGMTVVVTDRAAVPRIAPAEALLHSDRGLEPPAATTVVWQPERAPTGPVSIVISAADRRVAVLRNGILIGSAPVTIGTSLGRTTAYVLQSDDGGVRHWLRVALPGQSGDDAAEDLRGRIQVPDSFRQSVEEILAPGTTVVLTTDSLNPGPPQPVVESDDPGRPE